MATLSCRCACATCTAWCATGSSAASHDGAGRFTGCWGVSRDVTDEHETRRALHETESRCRELVGLTPLAALIHRGGGVVDANPAALARFRIGSIEAMRGQDLREHVDATTTRNRCRSSP